MRKLPIFDIGEVDGAYSLQLLSCVDAFTADTVSEKQRLVGHDVVISLFLLTRELLRVRFVCRGSNERLTRDKEEEKERKGKKGKKGKKRKKRKKKKKKKKKRKKKIKGKKGKKGKREKKEKKRKRKKKEEYNSWYFNMVPQKTKQTVLRK